MLFDTLFDTLFDGRAGAWPAELCGPRVAAPIDPLLLTLRPPPIPPPRVGAKRVLSLSRGADCWFTCRSDMRRPSRDALKGSLPCTEPARARSLFEARTKLLESMRRPRPKSLALTLVTPLRPFTKRALRKLFTTITLFTIVVLL